MRINNNVAALNTWRNLSINTNAMNKSLERLASGFRINRAADDAAGLAMSERMRSQVTGLNRAIQNSQDAVSLIQTAEGALGEVQIMIRRTQELALQSANDTLTNTDRNLLQVEVGELIKEIDRIVNNANFNKKKLLDGTFTSQQFQIGPNTGQALTVTIATMNATALSINAVSISTLTGALSALAKLDAAIDKVSAERAKLGAAQNRLEHTMASLAVSAENLLASESRIRDLDMAKEMAEFTRNQILIQASTAMLAQANVQPQAILRLLG